MWALLLPFAAIGLSPAAPAPVRVALVEPSGRCSVRLVDQTEIALLRERLRDETALLLPLARRLLDDSARIRIGSARERVPAFGSWTYDWIQSYLASWHSIGLVTVELGRLAVGMGEGEPATRLGAALTQPLRQSFRERVLRPALPPGGLEGDLAHAGWVLDREWQRALERASQALLRAPAVAGEGTMFFDLRAASEAPSAALVGMLPEDPLTLLDPADLGSGFLFLRSVRPMASRLLAIGLRASQASAALLTGGALGVPVASAPAAVLGRIGGIAFYWGADWAIAMTDGVLHRGDLERAALQAIDGAEHSMVELGMARIEARLALAEPALVPPGFAASAGCP